MAEPKAKSKKMGLTDPVKEEEKAEAEVEAELRPEKEEENHSEVLPKDISDTNLLPSLVKQKSLWKIKNSVASSK
jgi:hypothetical protein